jgi:hypothetical protein
MCLIVFLANGGRSTTTCRPFVEEKNWIKRLRKHCLFFKVALQDAVNGRSFDTDSFLLIKYGSCK